MQRADADDAICACTRRALLGGLAAAACLAPIAGLAQAANPAARVRPQPGDRLALVSGERAGQPIAAREVLLGAAPLAAWPLDPADGLLRNGSRLNQLRILRLDPATLSPRTTANAAEGVVAYSAMCSHAGCDVTGWDAAALQLICPCHGSTFSALDAGAIAKGPASKPLAMLPLRIQEGELRVASAFTRRVGFTPA